MLEFIVKGANVKVDENVLSAETKARIFEAGMKRIIDCKYGAEKWQKEEIEKAISEVKDWNDYFTKGAREAKEKAEVFNSANIATLEKSAKENAVSLADLKAQLLKDMNDILKDSFKDYKKAVGFDKFTEFKKSDKFADVLNKNITPDDIKNAVARVKIPKRKLATA